MLSGISSFDPSSMMDRMQNKMQERIQQFDSDDSGTISKSEFTDAMSHTGMDDKLGKMFDIADTSGDGELSVEEQSAVFDSMKERMSLAGSSGMSGFVEIMQLMSDSDESESSSSAIEDAQNSSFDMLMEAFSADNNEDDGGTVLNALHEFQKASEAYSRNSG
ncbi:MAG: EF-hand domain-containing protein [Planctomycetota bacterium]